MDGKPVSLAISKADARVEFARLIESWRKLVLLVDGDAQIQAVATAARKHHKHTATVFRQILTANPLIVDSRSDHELLHSVQDSIDERPRNQLRFHLLRTIKAIEDLCGQLLEDNTPQMQTPSQTENCNTVFVVHGHDQAAKESVARVIERLNLRPIVLNEQRNRGQTIIEKFEAHSNCSFAVVVLTPDDEGRCKSTGDKKVSAYGYTNRARQNVVLELGFFIGKIGRHKVCALVKGDVEIPSDFDGVVYVPMDDHGAWRTELAKEMKAAGLPVDLNDLHND